MLGVARGSFSGGPHGEPRARAALDFAAVFEASPNAYMLLDRELRYVAVNRAYLRVTASRAEDLLGRHILEAFPNEPEDPDNDSSRRLVASLEKVLATGEPDVLPMIRYRVPIDRDEPRRFETSVWSATHTPIEGADGSVAYILQHTANVTALARAPDAPSARDAPDASVDSARVIHHASKLLDAQQQLFQVFDRSSSFLCYMSGPRHVFELVNPAFYKLVGFRDLLGRPAEESIPEVVAQGYVALLDRTFATAEPYVGRGLEVSLGRRPGEPPERRFVDFVFQPIEREDGAVAGILVEGRDVTDEKVLERERRAAIDALRESEARLRRVVAASRVGTFEIDLARREIRGDALFRDILGIPPGHGPIDAALALARVHPDDRARMREAAARALAADGGGRIHEEHRIATAPGEPERWVEVRGQIELDGAGAPMRFLGTSVDITERKRAAIDAAKLARVLEASPDFVGIAGLDGSPEYLNRAGQALVGVPDHATSLRVPIVEYFPPEQRARFRDEILPSAMRDGLWEGESALRHFGTGEAIPVFQSVFQLKEPSGRPIALATITRDLRAWKEAERERQRLLENETEARAQAEQANRLKDEFLAMVSHELRTPLSAILGWTHLLRSGGVPPARHERALETIERNAKLQAQLIEDLLDVSRVMSGKLALERAPVDVAGVVAAAVESIRATATEKGIEVVVELAASGVVLADAGRLGQILGNLLSNAVKFTPEGRRVHVLVRRRRADEGHVEIVVRDEGIGIAPAFLPHVFEPFRQAEAGASRAKGGLGLGLAIVKHLAEAHGGGISVESDGPGRGATFTVRLPVAPRAISAAPARLEASRLACPRALEGMRVVVVDDEPDARGFVGALLGACGAEVTLASSADEGLAAVARVRPDALVSDIAMPGADGYTLIARVRALPPELGGATPAVAVSAFARAEDRERAARAGFERHLAKPIDPDELLDVLASLARP